MDGNSVITQVVQTTGAQVNCDENEIEISSPFRNSSAPVPR